MESAMLHRHVSTTAQSLVCFSWEGRLSTGIFSGVHSTSSPLDAVKSYTLDLLT